MKTIFLTIADAVFKAETEHFKHNPDTPKLTVEISNSTFMELKKDKEYHRTFGFRNVEPTTFLGYPLTFTDDIDYFKITVKGKQ